MGQDLTLAARQNFDRQQRASRWSEDVIASAFTHGNSLVAVHYGWSRSGGVSGAPGVREAYKAQYQESERHGKRPDLLLFEPTVYAKWRKGGVLIDHLEETPNTPDVDAIARMAVAGVEAETSGWIARDMRSFNEPAKIHRQWTKSTELWDVPMNTAGAVLPNIILKSRDVVALRRWQSWARVPVFVVSVFPDMYTIGIRMDDALELVRRGLRSYEIKFDKDTKGMGWRISHEHCFKIAAVSAGRLAPWVVTLPGGRIDSGYTVEGGSLSVPPAVLALIRSGYRPESPALAAHIDNLLRG